MQSVLILLIAFSFIMSASDLLPKRNWLRRVFTVSKLHQWMVSALSMLVFILFYYAGGPEDLIILAMGLVVLLNNGWSLRKYLPMYPSSIATGERRDVKLLALNVRQKNKNHQGVKATIQEEEADVLALTETDEVWAKELAVLDSEYPYHVKVPLNNTYGMILYSKMRIIQSEVKYLVSEEVPSIHADIEYKGRKFHLMFIHPEPPLDIRRLKEKDLEILKVSYKADDVDVPVVLCGDLNDVGWSYASRRMCEQTKLEDPRIGRGFFNTYNAHIPLFRYPIDHFFLSPSLKITEMKVLDKCGSDHFPVTITLQFP